MRYHEMNAQEIQSNLAQFIGTECYYKHWLGLKYTDGVKYLCDSCQSYWLIDAIASYQTRKFLTDPMLAEFQCWTLKVNPDKSATLTCERNTDDIAVKQKIPFTDFPLNSIKLYLTDRVLLLPSEY